MQRGRKARSKGQARKKGGQATPNQAVPYLAGAAGAVLATLLIMSAWLVLLVAIQSQQQAASLADVAGRAALLLAVATMTATAAAYLVGIPAAISIERVLGRAGRGDAGRIRYSAYALAGLAAGAVIGAFATTMPVEVLPIALLGGGAAVAGAAALRLAQRRPVLGRRLAIAVPAVLAVVALLFPEG